MLSHFLEKLSSVIASRNSGQTSWMLLTMDYQIIHQQAALIDQIFGMSLPRGCRGAQEAIVLRAMLTRILCWVPVLAQARQMPRN